MAMTLASDEYDEIRLLISSDLLTDRDDDEDLLSYFLGYTD